MNDNLGRYVKWQDDQEGWHTGREVCYPSGEPVFYLLEHKKPEIRYIKPPTTLPNKFVPPMGPWMEQFRLIKESCNGCLSWVEVHGLKDWQMRSEWEDVANYGIGSNTGTPCIN